MKQHYNTQKNLIYIFLREVIIISERSLTCYRFLVFQWGPQLKKKSYRIGCLMMIFILGLSLWLSKLAKELESSQRFTGSTLGSPRQPLRLQVIAVITPTQQKKKKITFILQLSEDDLPWQIPTYNPMLWAIPYITANDELIHVILILMIGHHYAVSFSPS